MHQPDRAVATALERLRGRRSVVVAENARSAERLYAWLFEQPLEGTRLLRLPARDASPGGGFGLSPAVAGLRARALSSLSEGSKAAGPFVLIVEAAALAEKLPVAGHPASAGEALEAGAAFDAEVWRERLEGLGYAAAERVFEPGQYAARPRVLDLFPAGADSPVRAELSDGKVDGLRAFDPAGQLPTGEGLTRVPVPAASEWQLSLGNARRLADAAKSYGFERDDVAHRLGTPRGRGLAPLMWPLLEGSDGASLPNLLPDADLWLAADAEAVEGALVAACERLRDGLDEIGHAPPARGPLVALARLAWPKLVLDEAEALAGLRRVEARGLDRALLEAAAGASAGAGAAGGHAGRATDIGMFTGSLDPGDTVLHLDHGVARLEGLEAVEQDGVVRDFVALGFEGGKRLMVPAGELDRVYRHGSAQSGAKLDKLDGEAWLERRAALAKEVEDAAEQLERLKQEREAAEAVKIEPEPKAYREALRGFGFELTPDQAAAIDAALADLASGKLMDRVVVGDVGFGKTEVALRAIAAVALSGRQSALLAPTTLLARQHFDTLRRRFARAGFEAALLTGSTPKAEREAALRGLAEGAILVAVGTQALLGPRVKFKNLALAVVDEEQRFGVKHKRALLGLKRGRHALAMSATPIPATLHAALAGVRDLSVIATPPVARLPVRTVVAPDEDGLLEAALNREMARGGGCFVVVPRVQDVAGAARRVAKLAPKAAVVSAHGRMPARELDDAVLAFADGDADVLCCTSIVETGLDIQRADTLAVLRPEMFGLAQLHQLRGRVGRGERQAYAFLLTDPDDPPGEAAQARLEALAGAASLGGGFELAAADLDQRGAGALFGTDQSGHLSEVGPELQADLLERALSSVNAPTRPEVEAASPLTVPETWIASEALRLRLHRRVAKASSTAALDELRERAAERFGEPPPEFEALLGARRLVLLCAQAGVAKLSAGPDALALDFPSDQEDRAKGAAKTLKAKRKGARVVVPRGESETLAQALDVLRRLADGKA